MAGGQEARAVEGAASGPRGRSDAGLFGTDGGYDNKIPDGPAGKLLKPRQWVSRIHEPAWTVLVDRRYPGCAKRSKQETGEAIPAAKRYADTLTSQPGRSDPGRRASEIGAARNKLTAVALGLLGGLKGGAAEWPSSRRLGGRKSSERRQPSDGKPASEAVPVVATHRRQMSGLLARPPLQ